MTKTNSIAANAVSSYPPESPILLSSESQDKFNAGWEAVHQWVSPRDMLESMKAADLSYGEWEARRLHRSKDLIIKISIHDALISLLEHLGVYDRSRALAKAWFTNKRVRKKVLALLGQFGLDESAIDAEALRRAMPDLEAIDRRLAELEARRDKIVRWLEDYRAGVSRQVGTSFDEGLDSQGR